MMFPHDVPDAEPPLGTIAEFRSSFAGGGGSSTGFMMRGKKGWSTASFGHDLRSWENLTSLDSRNAEIKERNAKSSARYAGVQVLIIAQPTVASGQLTISLEEAA